MEWSVSMTLEPAYSSHIGLQVFGPVSEVIGDSSYLWSIQVAPCKNGFVSLVVAATDSFQQPWLYR